MNKTNSLPQFTDDEAKKIVEKIATDDDADVILYCGNIYHPGNAMLHRKLRTLKGRRKNVFLFLTTLGGMADEAYRLARCLHNHYSGGKFRLFVSSLCKSAGTLMAIGAHEIIMSDLAELGPLDVQIFKRDEIGERTSGLTPAQALETLQYQTFYTFDRHFTDIYESLGNFLSTQSITQIATQLTIGCFDRIYQQIDPMKLAEYQRSVSIAKQYGIRLSATTENTKGDAIDRLITAFPSHEFVIDRNEAKTLFSNVRPPKQTEQDLADHLDSKVWNIPSWPTFDGRRVASVDGG
jgi:hypothetical protein